MNRMILWLAVCLVGGVGMGRAAAVPNVLLIYSDDHGWADLGIQGVDPHVKTPHLDALAKDGVLCKRGYVTAPQCTPSRAAVMTGRYQNRFGVEHNGIAMQSDVVTLPERLRDAGYISGISGKWHLDIEERRVPGEKRAKSRGTPDLAPRFQGFEEYFTGFLQDYSASFGLDGSGFADAPRAVHDDRCRVVIQTEATLAFLQRRELQPSQPWFHYLAYMAPHVPSESPEPWFSQTPSDFPKERRQALALIAAIDDGVGRIRAKLEQMGQAKNTLIFFIGDNGAPLGNSWDGSINEPMRGQKGMLSEGGIRVPFLISWPGTIPGGQAYDKPVISLDVAATVCAAAGVDPAKKEWASQPLDGVDLLPYLTGKKEGAPHETLYWRWMAQAAIQEFPYKLISLGGKGNLLFDVTTPEGEQAGKDLIQKEPELAARLEAKLKAWTAELDPPGMPSNLTDHHVELFQEHGISAAPAAPKKPDVPGTIQGWICRNGTLSLEGGAMRITPTADAGRAFIAHTGLDLVSPVDLTMRLRSRAGARSSISWRTQGQTDFMPGQGAEIAWTPGDSWEDVSVVLASAEPIIHLRITPEAGSREVEFQFIELRDKNGRSQSWRFYPLNPAPTQ
jgi:uncharacterized sulfatase